MIEARRAVYLQVATLVLVVSSSLLLSHFFPVLDFVVALQRRVLGLGTWSAICYPLLFAGCNVLLLPGGILCVGAGFFFGLWWGFFIVLLGNSIGAAISFAISRWLGTRLVRRQRAPSPMFNVLKKAVERDAWKAIFLTQLHPLFPTSLLNYLYGLTPIRFGPYLFWTTVGRAPGLFLYTYLGTLGQFGLNLALGKTHPRVVEYWIWGGAFIITVWLFIILTRVALKAVPESEDLSPQAKEHGRDSTRSVIVSGL
jgi:uncharacterized membrane protein YdjX (TVP38/TMEM64 family)